MFKIINKTNFPTIYPKVIRKEPTLDDAGYIEIGGFKLRDNIDYCPQLGIQEEVIHSDADIIFMAGAATMGKTFAIMLDSQKGVGKYGYTASIISKRLVDSAKGGSINRDFKTMYDGWAGFSVTTTSGIPVAYSEKYENSVRLLHSNFNSENKKEWSEFMEYAKKVQSSFIAIDEITDMSFRMWIYWLSRNRDSSGQRPRMLASFNPMYEHFSREMIDWYIDPKTNYVIPERIGVKRYLFIGNSKSPKEIIWGNSKKDILSKIDIPLSKKDIQLGLKPEDMIKSFAFFTGEAADNKILVHATSGGSIANLMNSGDAERLKFGYYGPIEDYEVSVSSQIIRRIFSNPIDNDETMRMSLDLSAGGEKGDLCVAGIFKGTTLIHIEQCAFYNDPVAMRNWIRNLLSVWNIDEKNMSYDAGSIGFFVREFRNGFPITGNSRQLTEYDEAGNIVKSGEFRTLRSQLMAKLEAMILRGEISCAIDKDMKFPHGKNKVLRTLEEILIEEKDVFKKTIKDNRIYYKGKDEFKRKNGFSPDITDVLMYFCVFMLDLRPKKQEKKELTEEDYLGLYEDLDIYF